MIADDAVKTWTKVSRILDDALDLADAERAAFVRRACAGDPELQRHVETLLAAAAGSGDFLETPALAWLGGPGSEAAESPEEGSAGDEPVEDRPVEAAPGLGARFGAWRVVRPIGQGGMGTVVLAARDDGQFQQSVALKILDREVLSRESMRRFLMERRILARLDHPHIARLLDGGVEADGTPWFAMEHVEGTPIDAYCDRKRLPVDERLRLFLQVCSAVQYAHGNLVVHRDLKPANILVTEDGRAKLLDFGIAKLLDDGGAEETRATLVLTPRYAAPEQIAGGPVTTATDVYALGLVLYELLTGERAHRGEGALDLQRSMLETDPERPSRRVRAATGAPAGDAAARPLEAAAARGTSPRQLQRRLAGDLDAIVGKALCREPERRYPTVALLQRDLEDHLASLPVEASRGTSAYRLRKFLRRHRAQAIAASLVVLALVAGLAAAAAEARVAAAQRDRARAAEAATAAINDFLVQDLLGAPAPESARGRKLTVEEVLDTAARSVPHAFPDQPGVESSVRMALARTYSSLGDAEAAVEHAEAAFDLLGPARGEEDPEALRIRAFLADLRTDQGAYAEARAELEGVMRLQAAALGPEHLDTLETSILLGRALHVLGEHVQSEALLRRTLGSLRSRHPGAWRQTLQAQVRLAHSLNEQRKLVEAETAYREAIAVQESRLGPDHPETLATQSLLAVDLQRQGRLDEAETLYRAVLDARLRILGENHPATADVLLNLGSLYDNKNDPQAAIDHTRRAFEIYRASLGEDHVSTLRALRNLGVSHRRQGRLDEAEPIYREVYAGRRRVLGEEHPQTIQSLRDLQILLLARGRADEARRTAEEILAIFERVAARPDADPAMLNEYAGFLLGVDPADLQDPPRAREIAERAAEASGRQAYHILDTLAEANRRDGRLDEAIEVEREALALPEGVVSWTAEGRLLTMLREKGDLDGAEQFLLENLARRRELRSPEDPLIGQTLRLLGGLCREQGRTEEAERWFLDAKAQLESGLPETDWRVGRVRTEVGELLAGRGEFEEAERLLRNGWETLAADPQVAPVVLEAARDRLVRLYEAWGRPAEADRWREAGRR